MVREIPYLSLSARRIDAVDEEGMYDFEEVQRLFAERRPPTARAFMQLVKEVMELASRDAESAKLERHAADKTG